MAREWIDEKSGCRMIAPDTVSEYLFMIWAVGYDYDGCRTVESLKKLVDELVDYAKKAGECLGEGRIYPAYNEPHLNNVPDQDEMQSIYDRVRSNIESTWPNWKIELANDTMITSAHSKKLHTRTERE